MGNSLWAVEKEIPLIYLGVETNGLTAPITGAGILDCAELGALEMLIMTDAIIGMAKRIGQGIEVSDETLMLDLIDQVGPLGEFISAPETAARCRDEIHIPLLLDKDPWTDWQNNGASSKASKST